MIDSDLWLSLTAMAKDATPSRVGNIFLYFLDFQQKKP